MRKSWGRRVRSSRAVVSFRFRVARKECFELGTRRSQLRTQNWKPSGEPGFTLLELLISMTILALIFIAVLGAIQVGSKSWESGERRAEANQRMRSLVDSLARELTMIYPLRIKDQDKDIIVFHGKSDSLVFATFPRSYGAEPFSHMIRVVEYAVAPDAGLVATESYPLAGAAAGSDSLDGRAKSIDDQVSDVRFRYLVPEGRPEESLAPVWRDFWDPSQDETLQPASQRAITSRDQRALKGSDRLPLAVELTLTIRREERQGSRELILPPLIFPVYAGRTL